MNSHDDGPGRPGASSLTPRRDGSALIRETALTFDTGDKLNGSLYVCDPADGGRAASVDAAIGRLRAAGLWSDQPSRQVQADQKAAYEAQLRYVESWEFVVNGVELVIARYDHPKFPSSAARFAAWKQTLGGHAAPVPGQAPR